MLVEEFEHHLIDEAVAIVIEVFGTEDIGNFNDGVFVEQQRSQNTTLGFEAVGWDVAGWRCVVGHVD